jgi:hypothetical protein
VSIDDLDGATPHFDGLDVKVPREETCVIQIWQECLAEKSRPSRAESGMLAKALRHIGWVSDGKAVRFKRYGKQKVFRRN